MKRLLTVKEIDVIRAAASHPGLTAGPWATGENFTGNITVKGQTPPEPIIAVMNMLQPIARAVGCGGDPNANALFIAHARQDVPALLDHAETLEGMLADCAADEGRGLLLRYRRALWEILVRAEAKGEQSLGATVSIALIAREALAGK